MAITPSKKKIDKKDKGQQKLTGQQTKRQNKQCFNAEPPIHALTTTRVPA